MKSARFLGQNLPSVHSKASLFTAKTSARRTFEKRKHRPFSASQIWVTTWWVRGRPRGRPNVGRGKRADFESMNPSNGAKSTLFPRPKFGRPCGRPRTHHVVTQIWFPRAHRAVEENEDVKEEDYPWDNAAVYDIGVNAEAIAHIVTSMVSTLHTSSYSHLSENARKLPKSRTKLTFRRQKAQIL